MASCAVNDCLQEKQEMRIRTASEIRMDRSGLANSYAIMSPFESNVYANWSDWRSGVVIMRLVAVPRCCKFIGRLIILNQLSLRLKP